MNKKPQGLIRWTLLSVCLCLAPLASAQEGVEQRLDRLEAQMQRLIELMERQQGTASSPAPVEADQAIPAPVRAPAVETMEVMPPTQPAVQPAPAAAVQAAPRPAVVAPAAIPARSGVANIRYFVHATQMGTDLPGAEPLAQGLFDLGDEISLKPTRYGIEDRWWMSEYRDPSRYRSAGVLIETDFVVERAGEHEFVLSPKPAREGAAGVSAEMSVVLDVGDRNLMRVENERSWRARRASVTLEPGRYPLRLWVSSDSRGYGVSPIESMAKLQVRGPGEAAPGPLSRHVREPAAR